MRAFFTAVVLLLALAAPAAGHGAFFVEGDLLCWQARQQGLDLFLNTSTFTSTTTVDTDTSSVEVSENTRTFHRFHFNWRPGFRIGAGYDFTCYDWIVAAYWTSFHGRGHGSGTTTASSVQGHWNAQYDVLDLRATGPTFRLGCSFTWDAFAGIRAAQITQTIDASFISSGISFNPFSTQNVTPQTTSSTHAIHSRFKGIGPDIGINGTWNLCRGFGLYANGDGSLLYSHYKATFSDNFDFTTTFLSTTDPTTTSQFLSSENNKATTNVCQIVLDLGFGVRWQGCTYLYHQAMDWLLQLGWEHSQWIDHNAVGRRGCFCLDGLTFSANLMF